MVDVNRSQSAESPGNGKRWTAMLVVVALAALVIVGAVIMLESTDRDGAATPQVSADSTVATD